MSAVLEEVVVPDTAVLTATLQLDDAQRARLRRASMIVAEAEAYVIDGPEMAEAANNDLRATKAQAKELAKMKDDFVAPARLILANAAKWFTATLDAYTRKEEILKQKLLKYQADEKLKLEAEAKAREEAARKIRQEAEQKAAAERARAEEVARKARQEAAIAEAAAKKAREDAEAARQAGNKEAAAKAEREAKAAAAEQAKKEEQERQTKADNDRRARDNELAAAAAAQAAKDAERTAAAPTAALKGFASSQRWNAELDAEKAPTDADAIKQIAAVMGERPELVAYLKLDWVAIRRIGTAQKQHFDIPGLKCTPETTAVSRK